MAGDSSPKRPGRYLHRFGDKGKQSYWDGSEWTGESRSKASLFARSGAQADTHSKGALGWVLLGLGLGIAGTLVSQSGATNLGWFVAAAATVAWVLAALSARSRIGSVILWIIIAIQALGWLGLLLV